MHPIKLQKEKKDILKLNNSKHYVIQLSVASYESGNYALVVKGGTKDGQAPSLRTVSKKTLPWQPDSSE